MVNGEATFSYGGGGVNVDYASGGGTPISYKPTELKGYYKTQILSLGDLPFAKILLTKYNFILNKRDTVSYSEFNFTADTSYSPFSIPLIDMLSGITLDTITTIFYSSNRSPNREYASRKPGTSIFALPKVVTVFPFIKVIY